MSREGSKKTRTAPGKRARPKARTADAKTRVGPLGEDSREKGLAVSTVNKPSVLPWELTPVLERHRLVTLARVAVATRNRAFAEADRETGDTNWGLACKAHERLMHALSRLAGEHPWLMVIREGLYVMPLIGDVPVRLYRGAPDRPGSRHLDAVRFEYERSRSGLPRMAFDFMAEPPDGGPWYWLMAMETDAAGMVSRVIFVQANDAGETRNPWSAR